MEFITSGEFIQALKDYHRIEDRLKETEAELKKLRYLRYEKIKSPLDYDVVGYDKHNQPIRQIKGRSVVSGEQISESNDFLDTRISDCESKTRRYRNVLNRVDKELESIEEPLKSILILRYKEHGKLRKVCQIFTELYLNESGMYKFIKRETEKYYTPTKR